MRKLVAVGVVGVVPLLAGCLDMNQDLAFTADGQATMQMRMAMDASILALAAEEDGTVNFCDTDDMTDIPQDVTVDVERSTEGDNEVCVVTASGPIESLAAALNEGGLGTGNDEADQSGQITLTDEGDGVYVFNVAIDAGEALGAGEDAGDPDAQAMQEAMMQMALAYTAGRTLSWSVTAPRIVHTTGELSADGRTATYSLALSDLFTMPEAGYGFTARFDITP